MEERKYLVRFTLDLEADGFVVTAADPDAAAEIVRQDLLKNSSTPDDPESIDLVICDIDEVQDGAKVYRVGVDFIDSGKRGPEYVGMRGRNFDVLMAANADDAEQKLSLAMHAEGWTPCAETFEVEEIMVLNA
jgi:hypothetical protein